MTFKEAVILLVKKIPKGKVASYGQIAAMAGQPRAARQVGQILKIIDIANLEVPWWRVVNSKGVISIKGNLTATKELQRDFLKRDGVKISRDFKISMEKYNWKK
jgi:methylated-DNA-protein-cysteine methyltransferase-like protein